MSYSSEDGDDNPEASFHFKTSSSLPQISVLSIADECVNIRVLGTKNYASAWSLRLSLALENVTF